MKSEPQSEPQSNGQIKKKSHIPFRCSDVKRNSSQAASRGSNGMLPPSAEREPCGNLFNEGTPSPTATENRQMSQTSPIADAPNKLSTSREIRTLESPGDSEPARNQKRGKRGGSDTSSVRENPIKLRPSRGKEINVSMTH